MASNGKRMVKEDLIKYLEAVQTNNPDPSDIGGGGTDFTPTNGLEFTEVEGETYLGLTQATIQTINGELSETRKGNVTFYVTDTTKPALSFQNQDNYVEFKNGSNDGGRFGRRRETALDDAKFYFTNYWNGGRNKIIIPNTHTTEADKTIALGAKVGDTTYYAGNNGVIELPNSSVEKKLYLVTLYMTNLDSGVSFLTDNDYGLCVVQTGWETDLYESGALYSDLTADEKTKIQNVLKNIKAEPYDYKVGGIVQNMEGNSDIILSGTFAYHSDLVLNYLHNNNGTLSLTQENINFLDANGVLLSQLTISEDMKFSIVQIL